MINVVLYQPEIPQNTGNIIRTCAGTDTKLHLIKPLGFSLDEKYIRRSSTNHFDDVDLVVYENWEEFVSLNHGDYYFITRYGDKPHSDFDYSCSDKNIYFIFGSESSGLPKEILKEHLDKCLRIPMNDKIRSLNLSNCVCMVVYEALRQQDFNELLRHEPFKGKDYIKK